jgi:hypothetical protein
MAEDASLQGWEPVIGPDTPMTKVVELAFAYRGDVSLDMVDGNTIVGYLFNYQTGRTAANDNPSAEVIRTDTGKRLRLPYDQIGAIRFTGRDMAEGQSLEAWQRRRSANARAAEARE